MQFQISDVDASDLEEVLALNESEVPYVGKVNIERMYWFAEHATYFRVARNDGRLAGFLIGFRPGTDYDSLNYRWFCERYADFAYVDRIAVATHARRNGLASRLYDDFAATLPDSVRIMTCEVNVQPPNEQSMQYHRQLGFREVGTRAYDDGAKVVAMLLRDL